MSGWEADAGWRQSWFGCSGRSQKQWRFSSPQLCFTLSGFLLRVPLPNEGAIPVIPICPQVHRHPAKEHKPSAHLYKQHGLSSCGHRRLRLNVNPRAKTWIHFSSRPRENLPGERDPESIYLQPHQMRESRKHSCCLYCIPRGAG